MAATVALAEQTNQPPRPLQKEQLEKQLQGLTPEERRAKLNELGGVSGIPDAYTNQLQELKNLPPDQRRAKLNEMREKRMAATNVVPYKGDLAAHRGALKTRMEALRAKKKNKTITPEEEQQLERMEALYQKMEQQRTKVRPAPAPLPPTRATNAVERPSSK
jgi:hypothetical protein